MKKIIIVGAGSVACEVLTTIEWINHVAPATEKKYQILGFIDDDENALNANPTVHYPLLGGIRDWKPIGDEFYAMGIASPRAKETVSNMLLDKGCRFETIIAPNATVSPYAEIGVGCFIASYCISGTIRIGNFVNIQGSMVGGDATSYIGDYSTTLGFANIANSRIGKRVYIGSHAVVLNVSVGDDALVSVGSIVVSNVKPGTKVFGNPAKRVSW